MSVLMKRNPFFFDEFFTKDLFDWNDRNYTKSGNTLPSVNVKESDTDFQIELAAPGMAKEDFKINLERNVLSIGAEKKQENESVENNGNYTRREFNYQSFSRSFTLPQQVVDTEKIEANYTDGILKITVPKKEVIAQTVKQISVN